jgi:hypothetical protein
MAKELKHIDISNIPELLSIAREVRSTNEPRILRQDSEDLAILTPIKPAGKRVAKGKPTSVDDPLWQIVGMARSEGPGDVAENVNKYLSEAYLSQNS